MKKIILFLIILIVSCTKSVQNNKQTGSLDQSIQFISSAELGISGSLDFGTVSQNTLQSKIITYKNNGLSAGKLQPDLNALYSSNGVFSINYSASDCFVSGGYKVLQPGQTCQIEVLLNSGMVTGPVFSGIPLYDVLNANLLVATTPISVVIDTPADLIPKPGKTCLTNYHNDPITNKCLSDYKDCTKTIDNAVSATRHWDSSLKTYGICTVNSCSLNHASSNNGTACALSQINVTINKMSNNGVVVVKDSTNNLILGSCLTGSSTCVIPVTALTNISIETVADSGYIFSNYSDVNCFGSNPICSKTGLTNPITINPIFNNQFTITGARSSYFSLLDQQSGTAYNWIGLGTATPVLPTQVNNGSTYPKTVNLKGIVSSGAYFCGINSVTAKIECMLGSGIGSNGTVNVMDDSVNGTGASQTALSSSDVLGIYGGGDGGYFYAILKSSHKVLAWNGQGVSGLAQAQFVKYSNDGVSAIDNLTINEDSLHFLNTGSIAYACAKTNTNVYCFNGYGRSGTQMARKVYTNYSNAGTIDTSSTSTLELQPSSIKEMYSSTGSYISAKLTDNTIITWTTNGNTAATAARHVIDASSSNLIIGPNGYVVGGSINYSCGYNPDTLKIYCWQALGNTLNVSHARSVYMDATLTTQFSDNIISLKATYSAGNFYALTSGGKIYSWQNYGGSIASGSGTATNARAVLSSTGAAITTFENPMEASTTFGCAKNGTQVHCWQNLGDTVSLGAQSLTYDSDGNGTLDSSYNIIGTNPIYRLITITKTANQGSVNVIDLTTSSNLATCSSIQTSCIVKLPDQANISIQPVADSGYFVNGYSDATCIGNTGNCNLTALSANKTITPIFSANNYSLTITNNSSDLATDLSYSVLKNSSTCTGSCLSTLHIGDVIKVTLTRGLSILLNSVNLIGSNTNYSVSGDIINFTVGATDLNLILNLIPTPFANVAAPTASIFGINQNGTYKIPSTTAKLTLNSTIAKEVIVVENGSCTGSNVDPYSTTFNRVLNQQPTTVISVMFKNRTEYSSCFVFPILISTTVEIDPTLELVYNFNMGTKGASIYSTVSNLFNVAAPSVITYSVDTSKIAPIVSSNNISAYVPAQYPITTIGSAISNPAGSVDNTIHVNIGTTPTTCTTSIYLNCSLSLVSIYPWEVQVSAGVASINQLLALPDPVSFTINGQSESIPLRLYQFVGVNPNFFTTSTNLYTIGTDKYLYGSSTSTWGGTTIGNKLYKITSNGLVLAVNTRGDGYDDGITQLIDINGKAYFVSRVLSAGSSAGDTKLFKYDPATGVTTQISNGNTYTGYTYNGADDPQILGNDNSYLYYVVNTGPTSPYYRRLYKYNLTTGIVTKLQDFDLIAWSYNKYSNEIYLTDVSNYLYKINLQTNNVTQISNTSKAKFILPDIAIDSNNIQVAISYDGVNTFLGKYNSQTNTIIDWGISRTGLTTIINNASYNYGVFKNSQSNIIIQRYDTGDTINLGIGSVLYTDSSKVYIRSNLNEFKIYDITNGQVLSTGITIASGVDFDAVYSSTSGNLIMKGANSTSMYLYNISSGSLRTISGIVSSVDGFLLNDSSSELLIISNKVAYTYNITTAKYYIVGYFGNSNTGTLKIIGSNTGSWFLSYYDSWNQNAMIYKINKLR